MATPEGEVKKMFIELLERHRLFYWVNPIGPILKNGGRAKNPNKGMPDISVIQNHTGKHIFVELKSKVGKLSPDQIKWMERSTEKNVPTFIVRDIVDAMKVIVYAKNSNIDSIAI